MNPQEKTATMLEDADLKGTGPNGRSERKLALASFEGSFIPVARPGDGVEPWYRNRDYFIAGWLEPSIWKSAFIEGVAATCVVYISGQTTATLLSYKTAQVGAYVGISNTILISLFIYATAPGSGGHINPLITFSAILAGICPLSRGVLYMCAQTLGGALAGGLLAGIWGYERSIAYHGGGCFADYSVISQGEVFLNEVVGSFVLLYLAYGVGLDPRQATLFGPRLGPLLVGLSLGLITFATSGIAQGYAGAQMMPIRCLGYAIARRNFQGQWIWWVGPAAASVLMAAMYNAVPPYHAEKEAERKLLREQSAA